LEIRDARATREGGVLWCVRCVSIKPSEREWGVYGFNSLKYKTLIPQPLAPCAQMSEDEVDPFIDKWIHSCLETAGAFGVRGRRTDLVTFRVSLECYDTHERVRMEGLRVGHDPEDQQSGAILEGFD
jgi:hypothetical protein